MLASSPHSTEALRQSDRSDISSAPENATAFLTPREREIAVLVAKGFSNKEVGQILDISHWTVAAHLKATFLKLGLRRRGELAYSLRDVI